MIFSTYKLYRSVIKYDEFGYKVTTDEFISDIELSVSTQTINLVENGVVYNTIGIVGVTPFNGFEIGSTYKIMNDSIEYEVGNINVSRLTTLNLKRVIK